MAPLRANETARFAGGKAMKPLAPRVTLPPPVTRFLTELATDRAFGEEVVAPMRDALCALDREADGLHPGAPDALKEMQAIALIAAQPRSVRDRIEDIAKVVMAEGKVTVMIRRAAAC
jgi:hypothetical protein